MMNTLLIAIVPGLGRTFRIERSGGVIVAANDIISRHDRIIVVPIAKVITILDDDQVVISFPLPQPSFPSGKVKLP